MRDRERERERGRGERGRKRKGPKEKQNISVKEELRKEERTGLVTMIIAQPSGGGCCFLHL